MNSEIESPNSALLKISNSDISDYIKVNHFDFTSIEPTFFTKMSITYKPRRLKAFNAKLKKEKLRNYIHTEGKDDGNYLHTEAKIRRVSVFLENLLTKTQQAQILMGVGFGSFSSDEPSRQIGTQLPAIVQLDAVLSEPDFDRNVTSPRSKMKNLIKLI